MKKQESIEKINNIIYQMESTIIDFKNFNFVDIDDLIVGNQEFFIGAIQTDEERYDLLFYKEYQIYTKIIYKK